MGGRGDYLRAVNDHVLAVFGPERGFNPGKYIWALREDAGGTLFAGTMNGLFRFDAQRQRFEASGPEPLGKTTPDVVLALQQDRSGTFWGMFAGLTDSVPNFETSAWLAARRGERWEVPELPAEPISLSMPKRSLSSKTAGAGFGYRPLQTISIGSGKVSAKP